MATMQEQPAAIVIPAEYLEDVRSALVEEINQAGKYIATNHKSVLEAASDPERSDWADTCRVDRSASVGTLRCDMHLFDQVVNASAETKVTGDEHAFCHTLEAVVRVLSGRLDDDCGYCPIPMGSVLDLAERLRWAAEEAIRLFPGLDDRNDETEAVA